MTKFNLVYRISNTAGWNVFGSFSTIEEARAARKNAIRSGFKAPATRTTQGKVLGWNIVEGA
jgi:hypothetical protein